MQGKLYKPETITEFDIRWWLGDSIYGETNTNKILKENGYKYGVTYPISQLSEILIKLGTLGNLSLTTGQNADRLLTLFISY